MNDDRLTEALAAQVLGWKAAPGRFLKSDRGWTPTWRFAPLTNLEDAFDLLDHAASTYKLATDKGGSFSAEVRVGRRTGKASGEPKARTITIALAHALGLELPDEVSVPVAPSAHRRNPRSRSKYDAI
jgi:hypothetical protein